MRFKIAIAFLFLLIIGGGYIASSLPFFTDTLIYKDYIIGYMPLIRKGFSILIISLSAYIVNISFNLILIKSFASVIRSSTLAKKVFPLIHWTISIAVWIVSIFFILGTIGINITALITGAGIGGILFALASKEFISNLIGSLSLIFSKNFKIGDTLKIKGYEGIVDEISLSCTRLIDKKGTVIFMPNKLLISETIENLSMAPMKRVDFTFDILIQNRKKVEHCMEILEKSIMKFPYDELRIKISIEGISEKGVNILLKIETSTDDISLMKKNVWLLIQSTIEEIKKDK